MAQNPTSESYKSTVNDEIEIDLLDLLRQLLKAWKTIMVWCIIAGVVGLIIGFSIPKEYSVKSTLAPEVATKTAGGNLGSLASLAGINLGTMGTADAVYPELYPQIVRTNAFMTEFFPMEVTFESRKETLTTDLYTYLRDYTRRPWWGAAVKGAADGAKWCIRKIVGAEEPEVGYENLDPSELTKEQEGVAEQLRDCISVSVDQKTNVITIGVTTQDPHISAKLNQAVIEKLLAFVADYRTGKARHDLEYYQQLFDEAQSEYYDAQKRYARYVDAHQNVVLASVRTEQERLQNEMSLKYQLYNSCAQQLQVAKAKVQEEMPVGAVIEAPCVPVKHTKPSKLVILVLFVFLGAMASSAWILWGPGAKKAA